MGNSTSKRKTKHSRSRSDIKNRKNKHKYRNRSPSQPTDNSNNDQNKSNETKYENHNPSNNNIRRVLSLNDIGHNKPAININILVPKPIIPKPHALNTPQISESTAINNNSNSNTPQSFIDTTIDNTNTHSNILNNNNNMNIDLSITNHYRHYNHRMQNSASNTMIQSTTTYNKMQKTPTLPDPNEIEDFGLDDDEAYNNNNLNNNKYNNSYLSPSIEPIPKSCKSIDSIPLSAISKMSVSRSITDEYNINNINDMNNEGSLSDDTNNSSDIPIKFRNYYSEPNNDLIDNKKYKKRIKRIKSQHSNNNNEKNKGLLKVRSTPNLQSFVANSNNNSNNNNNNNNNN
eukprot:207548_1